MSSLPWERERKLRYDSFSIFYIFYIFYTVSLAEIILRQCPRVTGQPVHFKVATKSFSGSKKPHTFPVVGLWFADLLRREALAPSSTLNAAATLSALARAAITSQYT